MTGRAHAAEPAEDPRADHRPPPTAIWARGLAWLAAAISGLSLIGWVPGVPGPPGTIFGDASMAPLSAGAVLLCAFTLLRPGSDARQRLVGRVFTTGALLIGATSASRDLVRVARGADYAASADSLNGTLNALQPAWPAPSTAGSLVLVSVAILLVVQSTATQRRRVAASASATLAVAIALFALVGYAYDAPTLQGVPGHRPMAMSAAMALAALGVAVMVHPSGHLGAMLTGADAGAVLARLLLPVVLVVPFALGALRAWGQRAGWYDARTGTALRTIAEMAVFATLALVAARRLRRADRDRERLIVEEQNARKLVDDIIDQLPIGLVLAEIPSGAIIRRNKYGEHIESSFRRGIPADASPVVWQRPDGTLYAPADYPLNRVVRDAVVIEQEEMIASLGDGSQVHVSVNAAPVYENGAPMMAVAAFVDMTPRRAAESALAERDALLASFFSAHDLMIAVVEADVADAALAGDDVDYRFLLTNSSAAGIFAGADGDVNGRTARELGIPPDRRRSFVEVLADAYRADKPISVERTGLPPGHGVQAPVAVSILVSPLSGSPRRMPRFCLIATDVSHQRHLEEELRQAQKLEAVGRLAGGIAHDFNNLLTAIMGFTRFAMADLPPHSRARADLDQSLRAADRAAALTHQLLAFSRQQVLQPQLLDLNQVVSHIEPMLRRLIGEHIRIHQALAAKAGGVRADRSQLEQVLVNLVVNARDAMPDGGVLTIETADVELEASEVERRQGACAGPHVMLAVTDSGVGMSAETRDRIFEPFFTTKEAARGTGLGLATVFGIVKQSGGSISVYSEPRHGTTFRIYLPREDGPPDTARPAPPVPAERAIGRILLVEDERAVRELTARILQRDGYDVVAVSTGREAMDVFTKQPDGFDLILTDLVLPELGGRALIRALGARGPVPPVVYMSGYTAEAMSAQSILDPSDRFIEKPFTADGLVAKVREALRSKPRGPRRVP